MLQEKSSLQFSPEFYTLLIENNPTNNEFYFLRGNAYYDNTQYDEAINDYTEAINLDQNYLEAYYNRGYTYYQTKRYDEAIKDYTKVREINPDYKIVSYSYIGIIYICKEEWEKAAESFHNAKYSILDILTRSNNMNKIKEVVPYMLKYNGFFIEKTEFEQKQNIIQYGEIYIIALKIIALLHVKNENENLFAHYTTRATATKLLLEKTNFRLYSTLTSNDPEEGKTLLKFLKIKESKPKRNKISESDYQTFIGCFTFNNESLNQFRLYGKESDREATGLSLVINKSFFSKYAEIKTPVRYEKDSQEDNREETSYALFRCIYIDPETNKIISLGQKEEYSFYREFLKHSNKKEIDAFKNYKAELDKKKDIISKDLKKLFKNIKDKKELDKNIISELLLPLRYLVKHVAFKEEQECRIFEIKDLKEDKKDIKFTPDYTSIYIDYKPITDNLNKVIFAPKAENFNVFKKAVEQKNIGLKCEVSKHPFSLK